MISMLLVYTLILIGKKVRKSYIIHHYICHSCKVMKGIPQKVIFAQCTYLYFAKHSEAIRKRGRRFHIVWRMHSLSKSTVADLKIALKQTNMTSNEIKVYLCSNFPLLVMNIQKARGPICWIQLILYPDFFLFVLLH